MDFCVYVGRVHMCCCVHGELRGQSEGPVLSFCMWVLGIALCSPSWYKAPLLTELSHQLPHLIL